MQTNERKTSVTKRHAHAWIVDRKEDATMMFERSDWKTIRLKQRFQSWAWEEIYSVWNRRLSPADWLWAWHGMCISRRYVRRAVAWERRLDSSRYLDWSIESFSLHPHGSMVVHHRWSSTIVRDDRSPTTRQERVAWLTVEHRSECIAQGTLSARDREINRQRDGRWSTVEWSRVVDEWCEDISAANATSKRKQPENKKRFERKKGIEQRWTDLSSFSSIHRHVRAILFIETFSNMGECVFTWAQEFRTSLTDTTLVVELIIESTQREKRLRSITNNSAAKKPVLPIIVETHGTAKIASQEMFISCNRRRIRLWSDWFSGKGSRTFCLRLMCVFQPRIEDRKVFVVLFEQVNTCFLDWHRA